MPEPPPPPPDEPPAAVRVSATAKALLKFEDNDEGNAEAVWSLHGQRFRHVKEWGWLHYTGTHWTKEGAEAALQFAVVEVLRARRAAAVLANYEAIVKCSRPSMARVNATVAALMKHAEAFTRDFDQAPLLLNVANGVVDLATGALIPHAECPAQMTYCLAAEYHPDADYLPWLDFLREVVGGGAEVHDWLQEAVGYSLTGLTREECLFYIYGPSRSGKGTFTEALLALLGAPLAVEMDFNTFASSQGNADAQNFALAPLKPSRMVFASESGRYQMLNEAKVKALTGGNDIRCAFKGRDHFSYRPQFKVWLSSNEPPKGDADDDAFWGRIRLIEFPNSHLGEEDKGLKERMKRPDMLRGILAWAVEGAVLWHSKKQGLVTPDAVTNATLASREQLDTVQQWLDEATERTPGEGFVAFTLLHSSYSNWCEENGHKPRGGKSLSQALQKKGYEQHRESSAARTRGFQGLRLSRLKGHEPPPPPPDQW